MCMQEPSPFAASRSEWDEGGDGNSAADTSGAETTDHAESAKRALSDDELCSSRAEFDSSEQKGEPSRPERRSTAPAYTSWPAAQAPQRPRQPSPLTPTRALRLFVSFAVRLVNDIVLPTFYVLSLAWHDYKVKRTAAPLSEGESKYFLPPAPMRRQRAGKRSVSTEHNGDSEEGENRAWWGGDGKAEAEKRLSAEERQVELVQDAAIKAADVVQGAAASAWGMISETIDAVRDGVEDAAGDKDVDEEQRRRR
jgi:hypothetical protein